jgi:hypothetical protein
MSGMMSSRILLLLSIVHIALIFPVKLYPRVDHGETLFFSMKKAARNDLMNRGEDLFMMLV